MTTTYTTTLSDRIETLTPALCRRVGIVSGDGLDARNPFTVTDAAPRPADDLYQQAVLTIIERAETEPEFLAQKDAYLVQAGVWAAYHQAEHNHAVENHTDRAETEPEFLAQKDAYLVQAGTWAAYHKKEKDLAEENHTAENAPDSLEGALGGIAMSDICSRAEYTWDGLDESWDIQELKHGHVSIEEEMIRQEHIQDLVEAVKKLSRENQVIIKMLGDGMQESEIASELGISRPAVSQRKKTIAANLAKFASVRL